MRAAILAAFVAPLGLYLASLRGSVSFWDTADLQTVPYILGIPYPTGFPGYVLAGWLWSHLFVLGPVALAAERAWPRWWPAGAGGGTRGVSADARGRGADRNRRRVGLRLRWEHLGACDLRRRASAGVRHRGLVDGLRRALGPRWTTARRSGVRGDGGARICLRQRDRPRVLPGIALAGRGASCRLAVGGRSRRAGRGRGGGAPVRVSAAAQRGGDRGLERSDPGARIAARPPVLGRRSSGDVAGLRAGRQRQRLRAAPGGRRDARRARAARGLRRLCSARGARYGNAAAERGSRSSAA